LSILRISYLTLFAFFVFIVIAATSGVNFPGDIAVSVWADKTQAPCLDFILPLVTSLGDFPYYIFAGLLLGLAFWLAGKRTEALFIIAAPGIGAVISFFLKLFIDRPRPIDDLLQNSFPSGHTVFTSTLMGMTIYFMPQIIKNKKICVALQITAGLLILLVGLSRLYLQRHWLSDVLAGLTIGILIVIPVIILYKCIRKEKTNARTA